MEKHNHFYLKLCTMRLKFSHKDRNISFKSNKKHINKESFSVEGKVIDDDGKTYKQMEGIGSNGFKVTLEFPEEECEEKSISIDLRNMMETLAFDAILLS